MSSVEDSEYIRLADAKLTTCNISDSLDKCGYRDQVAFNRLVSLRPEDRIMGRARTVRFEADQNQNPENPYDDMIAFIDSVEPGEIVVIATGRSNQTAFWGELFSAAAKARGALGMITDGNIRDTDKILVVDFPVYSISHRPLDYRGRMKVTAVQTQVNIEGVDIHPGDLLMADNDGVVVIPKEIESDVLEAARKRVMTESTVLSELLAGSTLREVWDKHHVL
jgi:regulator of RNase E activity RraA